MWRKKRKKKSSKMRAKIRTKFNKLTIHLKQTRRQLKKPQLIRKQPMKRKRRLKPKPISLLSMS